MKTCSLFVSIKYANVINMGGNTFPFNLKILVFLILLVSVINCYAHPNNHKALKEITLLSKSDHSSKTKQSGRLLKTSSLKLKKALANAKEIKKPKGYEKIMRRARKHDRKPQRVNEIISTNYVGFKTGRGIIKDVSKRWLYEMAVVIDSTIPEGKRIQILSAFFTLQQAMKCFRFKIVKDGVLPPNIDYLHIKESDPGLPNTECGSFLGRRGGEQITVISDKCVDFMGVTLHEVMHVLGFLHEHTRPDRDKYVKINWKKLPSSWASQYGIRNDQSYIKQYDFESIMHYRLDKYMEATVNVPKEIHPGQRSHLSEWDIVRLQRAYPC